MVTMDVIKKCVGMLCGVDPGLDAGVLTQRLGELETVKFSDFVKSMNYLSLFNDGDRQQALRKCGLSPKMSDLVSELDEFGINYGTAINLFWEETVDEDGVQCLSMVGFPRGYARFTADLEVLRDETLSAGPVGMQAVWQSLVAPSQVSLEPEVLAQAIVRKLVLDSVVSASDEVGYSKLLSSSLDLDVVQADASLQYLALFDETEKSAVFSDLGFSPDASALAEQVAFRKLSRIGYRCDLADVTAVDGNLVVRMVLNETSDATDRAELIKTLNVCVGSVFGHLQCKSYPRYVWASDGLCYLDAFLLERREEMRVKHGTLPVLTDVFSLENACGFDYDRMRSLYVHFLHGIAHISSVPSDLSVLFMVTQLANPRHPIRGCMAQIRVGGHSGSKIRRDYNVGRVSAGEKFPTDLPIDFDFGQDVTCAEGNLLVEQLPVPEGLVVIALSPEERLRAEEELEWLDVPVVLLSHVEDKEFAHVWVVSYSSEYHTKLVSKLRVTADSGHTFGFLEGPKVGGLNREIRLWCKSEAVGLGFTLDGVEVGKDPDKFLEWCDIQTVGVVPELVELPVSAMLGSVIGDPYRPLDVVVDDLVRGCSTVERARHLQMPEGVSVFEDQVVHLSSSVDMGKVSLVWDNLFLAERDLNLEMVVAVVVWAARRGLRCDVQLMLKDGIWYVVPKEHASIRDALVEMVDTLKREVFAGDFRLRNVAYFKETA